MKNLRRILPPLDALLFFEAAARHAGFTAAAEELHVTQAAVSKRIRSLEERLGSRLFERRGRSLALTAEGRLLQSRTSEALQFLADACQAVRGAASGRPITVAANVAVSHYWLGARLTEYQLDAGAAPLRLLSSNRVADLLDTGNDLVVHYASAVPPGWRGTPLFEEVLVPLAAPSVLRGGRPPRSLPLLDYEREAPDWVNWQVWLQAVRAPLLAAAPRLELGSYLRSVDAAVRGRGVALGCPALLAGELAGGRLAEVPGGALATGRGYWLLGPQGAPPRAATAELQSRLLAEGGDPRTPRYPRG